MKLELIRPLIWIDTETTGLSTQIDRIVQIGLIKTRPGTEPTEWQTYVNPTVPIPPEATEIHGITDDMVKDAPTFATLAPVLFVGFQECDFGGYNVWFDLMMLAAEFKRVDRNDDFIGAGRKLVDANKIFHMRERRTLEAAVLFYLGEEMEGAHDAATDIRYTQRVLEAQLEKYTDLPQTVDDLHEEFFGKPKPGCVDNEGKFVWRFGKACFNFGKFPGIPINAVDHAYLRWMLNAEFSPSIKKIVSEALEGRYPTRAK